MQNLYMTEALIKSREKAIFANVQTALKGINMTLWDCCCTHVAPLLVNTGSASNPV